MTRPLVLTHAESTGGLAALGVQLKENEVPVVRRVHGVEGGCMGTIIADSLLSLL